MSQPCHIAIIMDGNGRWAAQHQLPRSVGHERGADRVREIVDACVELGIPCLTLYAFSSENWGRPKAEVDALMALLVTFLESELPRMQQHGIRLRAIGCMDSLPLAARTTLETCLQQTADNSTLTLTLALSYGARDELVRAFRHIGSQIKAGALQPEAIDETLLGNSLDTAGLPDPDLLIRTSGEQRLSNFLLWQAAYSELYFTPTLWPDFDREALLEALADFSRRERRYGLRNLEAPPEEDCH